VEKTIAELLANETPEQKEHRKNFDILQACYPSLEADWKGPILANIRGSSLANRMKAAVEFFTGAPVTLTEIADDTYKLECVGYRAGPCGDH